MLKRSSDSRGHWRQRHLRELLKRQRVIKVADKGDLLGIVGDAQVGCQAKFIGLLSDQVAEPIQPFAPVRKTRFIRGKIAEAVSADGYCTEPLSFHQSSHC